MDSIGNKKVFIIWISVIIVVLVGLVFCLVVLANGDKQVLVKGYNSLIKEVDKGFDQLDKDQKKASDMQTIKADGNLKVELDLSDQILDEESKQIQEVVNKSSIDYEMNLDYEGAFLQLMLKPIFDGESLAELETDIEDDAMYIKIKDVMDEYYKQDLEENIFEISDEKDLEIYKDIKVVYNGLKDLPTKIIKTSDVTSEKVKLDFGDEEIKVKKIVLTFDDELLIYSELEVYKAIINDDKVLESFVNIYNMDAYEEITKEEVEETFNKEIEELEEELKDIKEAKKEKDYESLEEVKLNVYTKGLFNKIVKVEFEEDDEKIGLTIVKDDKKEFVLNIDQNDEKLANINIINASKDNYEIKIDIKDFGVISINGIINDKKVDVEYKLDVDISGEELNIKGRLFAEEKVIKKDKQDEFKFEFSIDTGKDLIGSAKLIYDMNITYGEEINKPDLSKSTTEIDDETSQKLNELLVEIIGKLGLDFEQDMYPTEMPDYDYDQYDSDYNYEEPTFNFDELNQSLEEFNSSIDNLE